MSSELSSPDYWKDMAKNIIEFGGADTVGQYAYYKAVGNYIQKYTGRFGKWSDTVATLAYDVALQVIGGYVAPDYLDYFAAAGDSTFGRALSIALGDSANSVPTNPLASSSRGVNWSSLSPITLER